MPTGALPYRRRPLALVRRSQIGWHAVRLVEIGDCSWEVTFARQKDVSAQRVRSSLFLSVSVGTRNVFQPSVLEYLYRVSSLPQTVAIQTRCNREATNAMFDSEELKSAKARLPAPHQTGEAGLLLVASRFLCWTTSLLGHRANVV